MVRALRLLVSSTKLIIAKNLRFFKLLGRAPRLRAIIRGLAGDPGDSEENQAVDPATERIRAAAARIGQHVFAQHVLSNRGGSCVFCGLRPSTFGGRRMLLARHIKPWRDSTEEDKDAAEINGLMTRAESWPGGLRWIVRRVKPSGRQMRNLTAYEKEAGWRY
jgi:hypothetical protein